MSSWFRIYSQTASKAIIPESYVTFPDTQQQNEVPELETAQWLIDG